MTARRTRLFRGALVSTAAVAMLAAVPVPAFAVKPARGGGGGGGGGSTTPTGNDVSYPQCGSALPTKEAFGIVGLNGGLANDLNPCFGTSSSYPSYRQSQLYWALATATGATSQPRASVYVNTADPGNVYNGTPIADWPTSSSSSDPYGACATTTLTTSSGTYNVGQNSPACAWQYGWNRAAQDATWLTQEAQGVAAQETAVAVSTQPGSYPWWLDVETGNTWQSGSAGQEMNVADLQGMAAGLQAAGVTGTGRIGVYSTSYQWGQITGTPGSSYAGLSNPLWGTPDWIPGARRLSAAESNCSSTPFTGGSVTVTQWVASIDGDYACP